MVGAEMPMSSDQVIWTEQNRLHIAYHGCTIAANNTSIEVPLEAGKNCAIRKGATIVVSSSLTTIKARVTDVSAIQAGPKATVSVETYQVANLAGIAGATDAKVFVYGSEFGKGTDSMANSVEPVFKSFTNRPMIIKDHFEINGSDTAQIGWVEVSGEAGQAGYLWYMKAEGDTRVRFEDYLEMTMIEAEKVATGSGVADSQLHDLADGGVNGSEGLLAAIANRGIVATNQFDSSTPAADKLAEFDLLLKELDKQGSIEENMLFLDRDANLYIDDLLAGLNPHVTGGVNYGVFENSADMALNLGFTGFRRGSYDFYKTDWKYLNDASTRGLVGGLKGLLVPAGTSSVYDQQLGKNVRRPFLHVRYRASEMDDRRMKSWITGSVGGATASGVDKMEIHYLSERCLVTQAANNFIRFDS